MGRSKVEGNYVTEEIFCLLLRQNQKQDKKLIVQVFLARLLTPLSFICLPRFYLVLEALALGLIIGLAVSKAEFISRKVAVGLFS